MAVFGPTESYTCRAELVTVIEIENINLSDSLTYVVGSSASHTVEREGLKVTFSEEMVDETYANLTAVISIIDIQRWKGSNFVCRTKDNETMAIMLQYASLVRFQYQNENHFNQHRSSLSSHCSVSDV